MKNAIRILMRHYYLWATPLLFAGCYTQLETVNDEGYGGGNRDDYAYTDTTTSTDSNATVINNYFYDDDYRAARYRASFSYYYPYSHHWGVSIWYDPYYNDPWPWDPWYYPGYWYPTLVYPRPYWPHYGGYQPHYWPRYAYWPNNRPGYGGTFEPGRRRGTGSTRGDDGNGRVRGGGVAPLPVGGTVVSDRNRSRTVPEKVAPAQERRRSRNQVPWWDRAKSNSQAPASRSRVTDRARTVDGPGRTNDQRRNNAQPAKRTARPQQQTKQGGTSDRNSGVRNGGGERRVRESSPAPRQEAPHYSPAPRERSRSTDGNRGAGSNNNGGERSRRRD